MVKVFVTGADGFVGKHLIKILNKSNVDCVQGVRSAKFKEQVEYGDITLMKDWESLFLEVTCVVHLAARVHVMKDSSKNPLLEFRKSNVEATIRIAKAAMKAGVKKFIYVSSVKVNGEQTFGKPFTCLDIPNPDDAYAISKYEAELQLQKLNNPGFFDVIIIRPPLIYGDGVRANFSKLIKIVKLGIPLPFALVQNKRSFVSVLNLCDLILVLIKKDNLSGKTFMISDDEDLSLPDLIRKIGNVNSIKVRMFPFPVFLMRIMFKLIRKEGFLDRLFGDLQVDIQHTKEVLEWSPPYSLEESFKKRN